jgi:hypothetical protein
MSLCDPDWRLGHPRLLHLMLLFFFVFSVSSVLSMLDLLTTGVKLPRADKDHRVCGNFRSLL